MSFKNELILKSWKEMYLFMALAAVCSSEKWLRSLQSDLGLHCLPLSHQMPSFVASDLGLHCLPMSHQMPSFVASDLGLHCLPMSHKKDARLLKIDEF